MKAWKHHDDKILSTLATDMLDRQCARNADAVEMLAKLIFPECFEEEGQKAA